jgi:hypothetical protein
VLFGSGYTPSSASVSALAEAKGITMEFLRIPIRDARAPDRPTMKRILDLLDESLHARVPAVPALLGRAWPDRIPAIARSEALRSAAAASPDRLPPRQSLPARPSKSRWRFADLDGRVHEGDDLNVDMAKDLGVCPPRTLYPAGARLEFIA